MDLMSGLLWIARKLVSRCDGKSPIFASTIEEEATGLVGIAAELATSLGDEDEAGIVEGGLGRLVVHRPSRST